MTTVLLVIVGGALGAPLRYVIDVWVQSRIESGFPWGTLTVNAVGSFLLGITAGYPVGRPHDGWLMELVGVGFCGALTTFSTFSLETLRLAQEESPFKASVNVLGSIAVTLGACVAGWTLATAAS